MIDLTKILAYLDKTVREADIDKSTTAAVDKIKLMLENYQGTLNPEIIFDTLKLIESIELYDPNKTRSFFSSNPEMRQSLSKNFRVISTAGESSGIKKLLDFNEPIPVTSESVLGYIYQEIRQVLKPTEIAWTSYAHSVNDAGITNDEIEDFHQYISQIDPEQLTLAYRDFTRGFFIDLHDKKSIIYAEPEDRDVVDQIITHFVSRSSYSAPNKELLISWLKCRGGQGMNFFITDMLANQSILSWSEAIDGKNKMPLSPIAAIPPQQKPDTETPNPIKVVLGNWSLNDKNEIILHMTYPIRALNFNGDSTFSMLRCKDGQTKVFNVIHDDRNYNTELKSEDGYTRPLVVIDTILKLTIQDGHVIPIVTNLAVTSYTNRLKPENFYNPQIEDKQALARPRSSPF